MDNEYDFDFDVDVDADSAAMDYVLDGTSSNGEGKRKSNRIGEKKPTINLQKRKDVIDYCVHNNPIMDMNECSRLTKIPYSTIQRIVQDYTMRGIERKQMRGGHKPRKCVNLYIY